MFTEVSKNLHALLLKVTCFTNQQIKPFNKGCEYKLLHLLAWNPKTNLKIIHQPFDPGLPAISLLKEWEGALVQLAGLGTTQSRKPNPADQKSTAGTYIRAI